MDKGLQAKPSKDEGSTLNRQACLPTGAQITAKFTYSIYLALNSAIIF